MNQTANDMIYLISCAVNGITPNKQRCSEMDIERLYKFSKFHSLSAITCIMLEKAGICDHAFDQAKKKAIRKTLLLDMEREKLLSQLEAQGIWYMPLKGAILKNLYPETGMREMADNDILFDSTRQTDVKHIFENNGYTVESIGKGNHDVYFKPPVLNFEMHTSLYSSAHKPEFFAYYANIRHMMILDHDKKYGYHLSDHDFYVYITSHEYKHYSNGGTGFRSLADCYIYMKKKGNSLDFDYITQECEKLGIADFERERRELAVKLLSSTEIPILSKSETEMLERYLFSGTYGTFKNAVKSRLDHADGSKAKYLFRRIIPTMEQLKTSFPFFYRHKYLIPVLWVVRPIRALVKNKKRIFSELKYLVKV